MGVGAETALSVATQESLSPLTSSCLAWHPKLVDSHGSRDWNQAEMYRIYRASSSLQNLQSMPSKSQRLAVSSEPQATHPPSGPSAESPHHIRTARTMLAGFAAHGRSRLSCREPHWTAPMRLTAVQSGPWLHPGNYRPSRNTDNKTTPNNRERPSPIKEAMAKPINSEQIQVISSTLTTGHTIYIVQSLVPVVRP